ncbi:MAG TPA: YIP1 family protein [Vicinamibacterales bacterium]|nr:YIP1 family protein [Vicinamibacterales bacterium]
MRETTPDQAAPDPGLAARIAGVIMSPTATFEAVVRRPRALGVLLAVLAAMILSQGLFLATEAGQQAALDQQLRAIEAFGAQLPDDAVRQMEERMVYAPYLGAANLLVSVPLACAVVAALLHVVFGLLGGGTATFRQAFAVVAHAGVILAVSSLFLMPLSYARGAFAAANLGVFFPMLDETTFASYVLGAIDLFLVWWVVVVGIGASVLYRRRPGAVVGGLLGVYVAVALVIAFVRS